MYIPEDDETKVDDQNIEETEAEEEEGVDTEEEEGSDGDEFEDGADDQAEPEDLADAFARLRQVDTEDPADDVEGGDGDDESEDGGEPYEDGDTSADDGGYEAGGGSATAYDPAAYQDYEQGLMVELERYSVNAAIRSFTDKGIKPLSIGDLYNRTDDGRVVYRNPDDKSRPFNNRMEAQQWVDSFNAQLSGDVRREANKVKIQMAKRLRPSIELMRFAPRFDSMSKGEQEILDDLIEDYEVRNREGKLIGYSCDLNKMADKAIKLATKYNKPIKQKVGGSGKVKKSGPQKSPALDARTHGTAAGSKGDREPQTLEEAMMRLKEINRRK